MTKKALFLLFTLTYFISFGQIGLQEGWSWPEDQELFTIAQEKQAFSRVSIQLDNYQDAYNSLTWLYQNNPDLHESIYIDGTKSVEKLIKATDDPKRKTILEDSLMILFDMRMRYFGNAAEVMGRKAFAAFKLNYNNPAKYPLLASLYDSAYVLNPNGFALYNMTPYMTLAKYYHQRKPDEMPNTRVLDIHDRISNSIQAQMTRQPGRMKSEQDKVDALLSSIGNILSCDFIGNKLAPRLEADSTDLNTAKKIISYSQKAKCTDEPYFLTAGKIIYQNEPDYKLAILLANKHLTKEEYDRALYYFREAMKWTDEREKLYDVHYGMAIAYSKSGKKFKSRAAAYNAISVRPGDTKAYNIIGYLYYSSYDECKGRVSIVEDRAVFIAAYKMYEKAGNQEQMTACKAQFPSSEEIFSEDKSVGDEITVGCWINETVRLQRRD